MTVGIRYYTLHEGGVMGFESATDYFEWIKQNGVMEGNKENKVIAHDKIGEIFVSTVLLPWCDLFVSSPGPTFETMIFLNNADNDNEEWGRYNSIDSAICGHQAAVQNIIDNRLKYVMLYRVAVPQEVTSVYKNPYLG